jgi:hypothetical protein
MKWKWKGDRKKKEMKKGVWDQRKEGRKVGL